MFSVSKVLVENLLINPLGNIVNTLTETKEMRETEFGNLFFSVVLRLAGQKDLLAGGTLKSVTRYPTTTNDIRILINFLVKPRSY